jgi:camelysin-like metallo-endopeptidase
MQNTRTKVLRTLGMFAVLAAIAATGVFSAFSSQTDNPGNVVTAGTVTLSDNDGGSALYSLTAAKPGDSATSCIEVTYDGTLDATVKLFTPSSIGDLGPHVDLMIEPGTQASPSFPSCSGFTPDAGGALFDGTLASFAAAHDSYANGLADDPGTSATAWETDDTVVYRVTATLAADAPADAQGDSTGTHTLRWEAQNQ